MVSCCFLSTASSTLYTSLLGVSCCFYSLAIMNPLKPDLQNQLLFLGFSYWLVNTYCRQAVGPQGRMQSKAWLCLRSNRTWLCSMLLEYNTCCHAAKTDVCVCVMKHAGMAKASLCSGSCSGWRFSDWVAKKAGFCLCEESVYVTHWSWQKRLLRCIKHLPCTWDRIERTKETWGKQSRSAMSFPDDLDSSGIYSFIKYICSYTMC